MPKHSHKVHEYAQDVADGNIVAGKYVRLACERHLRDLERADLHFDDRAADLIIQFFATCLVHTKGQWAGDPFVLEPWQEFRVGSVWGWRTDNGRRRFREAYSQVARKNGKTVEAAGIGLAGLTIDGEQEAEVFSAATKRDQAKIVLHAAQRMVKASPTLRDKLKVWKSSFSIEHPDTGSIFRALGADADTEDGLGPSIAVIDELHAHRDRDLYEVLTSGQGARRQPLVWAITTAGFNVDGFCHEKRSYSIGVLEGEIEDDTLFAYIAELDDKDDWKDEEVWPKANPNLDVSVFSDFVRGEVDKAKNDPSKENYVRCKNLNQWVNQEERFIPMDLWDQCDTPLELRAA